ncbi:D-alanyl-D-alanine carboxypeptidase family protein [Arvimicrobium flavum]|uniref:D-alanyl-D-alanine carboxypeptidase family protein n=1 Tax=Arvimicrobium flavum TaxID=3393320 RepID=UPI00237A2B0B|nr:D-alanyl-D-alanine carboxypeptidase family protein [Mesorhizobium shangrilense]
MLAACTTATEALHVPPPPPLTSEKYAAIVVDGNSGRTMYQAHANAARYPASLTKMMTLYMLFEALDSGRVSRSTAIPVSAHAASQPPSKLGLKRGSTIDVDTAIDALTVKSANDVAAAVGEFLGGGSEDRFAAMMTARARQLGMSNTVFRNASGLPDDGQRTTARDMALLGIALKKRFPHHFDEFSARSFAYRGRSVKGHNRLLGRVEGVDGIKTGYIRASGYNIVTSVGRGGRRLVVVVMGGKSGRERDAHVEELIERYLPSAGRGAPPTTVAAPAIPPAVEQPVEQPVDEDLPGVGAPAAPQAAGPIAPDAALPTEGAEDAADRS